MSDAAEARGAAGLAAAWPLAALVVLGVAPLGFDAAGASYWTLVLARGLIYGVAAMALQLVLGRGGLVCFGFAAFMGIGAYAVGIPYYYGFEEGLITFPLAAGLAALFAVGTGAIALRTRGVYFIMITLAFGQMAFYFATSLSTYGGDDGMTLWTRSLAAGSGVFEDARAFYWLCLTAFGGTWALIRSLEAGPFGRALDGTRRNEARMRALGYDVFRTQLTAYALAGALGGIAGALLANHAEFVSPAYMDWRRSGELIVMVVLGGFSSLTGAAAGALILIGLEDVLAQWTEHWRMVLGLIVLGVALFARNGLAGALDRWRGR